ncbi:reverse transcriptase domain, reverse transcriptase zinc-binding domain protein [Tanacetum coccineum]
MGKMRGLAILGVGEGVWRDIIRVGDELEGLGVDFISSFMGEVGNGADIRFWINRWVGGIRLCDRFTRLYHLDRHKEGKVEEKGKWIDNVWRWKWEWVRNIRGMVCKDLEDLRIIFQNVVININCRDRWRWALQESGDFTVRGLTKLVEEKIHNTDSGGGATTWNNLVPKKVNIFIWRDLKGRLPVREELDKRGVETRSGG